MKLHGEQKGLKLDGLAKLYERSQHARGQTCLVRCMRHKCLCQQRRCFVDKLLIPGITQSQGVFGHVFFQKMFAHNYLFN